MTFLDFNVNAKNIPKNEENIGRMLDLNAIEISWV
jgi:hypothetical protein